MLCLKDVIAFPPIFPPTFTPIRLPRQGQYHTSKKNSIYFPFLKSGTSKFFFYNFYCIHSSVQVALVHKIMLGNEYLLIKLGGNKVN